MRYNKVPYKVIHLDSHIEIVLKRHTTKISKEDFYLFEKYTSWRHTGNYISCLRYIKLDGKVKREDIFLHNLVMGKAQKGFQIDHINRDKLDNRRENLRIITIAQNIMNRAKKTAKATSKYKGVYKRDRPIPWSASVWQNRKRIYLGSFYTENEAATAYNKKAKELWGEFAFQNIID